MKQGAFVVSIDVERAWGIWDKPSPEYFRRCLEKEGRIVERLVALFERHEVSATWAVVGRLLERDDERPGDRALWFAPDVVSVIRGARHPQEIGSHSYAHIDYANSEESVVDRDLANARRVHAAKDAAFASFVFPRNHVAHVDVLARHGVKVFRGVDRGLHRTIRERFGTVPGRVASLIDRVVPVPPHAVQPITHPNGVVEIPGSMLFSSRNGLRRAIHPRAFELKASLGLAAAARTRAAFHLWFHPSNFYYETEGQFRLFERILARARTYRDGGQLALRTMGSFAMSPTGVSAPA